MVNSEIPCMQIKYRSRTKMLPFTTTNFRLEVPMMCQSPACKSASIPAGWYLHDTRPRPGSGRSRGHIATHQHTPGNGAAENMLVKTRPCDVVWLLSILSSQREHQSELVFAELYVVCNRSQGQCRHRPLHCRQAT